MSRSSGSAAPASCCDRRSRRPPADRFVFVNLHLETARKGLQGLLGKGGLIPDNLAQAEKMASPSPRASRRIELNAMIRDRESERAAIWAIRGDKRVPVLVAGDFNLPVESAIFRRHWGGYTDAFDAPNRLRLVQARRIPAAHPHRSRTRHGVVTATAWRVGRPRPRKRSPSGHRRFRLARPTVCTAHVSLPPPLTSLGGGSGGKLIEQGRRRAHAQLDSSRR